MIRVLCNTRPVFVVVQSGRRVSVAVCILVVGLRSFSTDRDTVTFVQKLIATCVWLLETLVYVACMPTVYSSVDRANSYAFNISCCKIAFHIYIYIIFGTNRSCQCCVGFVLLTLSHKSPVVRPSIAQS